MNPRVQPGIDDIRRQVRQQGHDGADQGDGDYHRVIAGKNGIKGYPAQTGNAEDDFGQISSAKDHSAQIEHDYGHNRQDGIAEDMLADDDPLRQSFGPGSPHEFLVQIVQGRRPGIARIAGHHSGTQGYYRQDQRLQIGQGKYGQTGIIIAFKPAQLHREYQYQHYAEPEMGNGNTDQGEESSQIIDLGILLDSGIDADQDAQNRRKNHSQKDKLEGINPVPFD